MRARTLDDFLPALEEFADPTCPWGDLPALMDGAIVYLNIYQRTRHYGGPEEGGWWYDWDHCVCSVPVKFRKHDLAKTGIDLLAVWRVMEDSGDFRDSGDIGSVNGGEEFYSDVERTPAASETKERPRYE